VVADIMLRTSAKLSTPPVRLGHHDRAQPWELTLTISVTNPEAQFHDRRQA
jgi:hypothetical protein